MIHCPNCGREYAERKNFCGSCGTKLPEFTEAPPPLPPRPSPPTARTPPPPPPSDAADPAPAGWLCGCDLRGAFTGSFEPVDCGPVELEQALAILARLPVPPAIEPGELCAPTFGLGDDPLVERSSDGSYFLVQEVRPAEDLADAENSIILYYRIRL